MENRELAKEVFDLSENSIYRILDGFDEKQNIDKSLTYIFIKAFYLHTIKIYLSKENKLENFDNLYLEYKNELKNYYIKNNSTIPQELMDDILNAFDKSYEIIESLGFNNLDDGYEFRHHIVDSFELLRKILEKKSKNNIRVDIFEKHISTLRNQAEEILDYIIKEYNN